MAVHARFWVQKVEKICVAEGNVMRTVTLQAKVRGDANDNVDWSRYTPSGTIVMSVTNDDAGQWYEDRLGQDVAIVMDDPVVVE